jgi:hypothetical protein
MKAPERTRSRTLRADPAGVADWFVRVFSGASDSRISSAVLCQMNGRDSCSRLQSMLEGLLQVPERICGGIVDLLGKTIKHGKESTYAGNAVFTFRTNYGGTGYTTYRATVLSDGRVQTFHPLG